MLRYLALSAVLVVGAAVAVAAWVNRDLIRIKIASVYERVPPKPEATSRAGKGAGASLSGDAPWALSALPACLQQVSQASGTLPYVEAHVPRGAVPVLPPAKLTYGNCTISVVDDEAFVRRGDDLLHIPAQVRFYRAGRSLVLMRRSAAGADLRVYEPANP